MQPIQLSHLLLQLRRDAIGWRHLVLAQHGGGDVIVLQVSQLRLQDVGAEKRVRDEGTGQSTWKWWWCD